MMMSTGSSVSSDPFHQCARSRDPEKSRAPSRQEKKGPRGGPLLGGAAGASAGISAVQGVLFGLAGCWAWPIAASSASLMISIARTTFCTPRTPRAISVARVASRSVTRPMM